MKAGIHKLLHISQHPPGVQLQHESGTMMNHINSGNIHSLLLGQWLLSDNASLKL